MAGGPASRIVKPVMDSSSSPVICPMIVEMSGGLGLSLTRIEAASVAIPATRWANSSAEGSGLTAR